MPAMPRSRAIWKACAGRCRSTRPRASTCCAASATRRWRGAMRCERVCMPCRRPPPARPGPRLGAAGPGEAEAAAEHAGNAWAEARRAADAEATRAQMLQSQATASRTALLSPERVAQRQERAGRLAETRSHHDLLARRLGEAEAALDGQRPALIEQDALRFEQSAALEREAQQRRHGEMLQLQGKLDQAGAQGLGERLSEAEADCERLQRRRDELDRRAGAGLAVAAAERQARGRHPAAAGAAGAPAASLPWAAVPRSGAAPGRCLAARRLAARRGGGTRWTA